MKKFLLTIAMVLLMATVAHATSFTVTWTDNSVNEDGFILERKQGVGGVFTQVATLGADVTTFGDTTPDVQVYCYRVKAFNIAEESAYSNEACGTGPIGAPSGAIVIIIIIP